MGMGAEEEKKRGEGAQTTSAQQQSARAWLAGLHSKAPNANISLPPARGQGSSEERNASWAGAARGRVGAGGAAGSMLMRRAQAIRDLQRHDHAPRFSPPSRQHEHSDGEESEGKETGGEESEGEASEGEASERDRREEEVREARGEAAAEAESSSSSSSSSSKSEVSAPHLVSGGGAR